jgi:REP-associated tyrosine transposase
VKTSNGLPYRRSVRLPEFDYSGYGPYFITIDSFQKRMIFGSIVNDTMSLSPIGSIIQSEWIRIPTMRPRVEIGEFQVMPNHFHAILGLRTLEFDASGNPHPVATPDSLASIAAGFKAKTTSLVRQQRADPAFKVWQRGYFETVIRDDAHLERVEDYIRANVARWSEARSG